MPGLVDCGVVFRTALPSGNAFSTSFDQSLQDSRNTLMIKMPSGNRNIFFSHFSCTPVRMCVYGGYAPEFREVLKITAKKNLFPN